MNERAQVIKYVLADIVSSAIVWTLFHIFRKAYLEPMKYGYEVGITFDSNFYLAMAALPVFWVLLYVLVGGYTDIFRRFRVKELGQTLTVSALGSVIIFFSILLDDEVPGYRFYYLSLLTLFLLQFLINFIFRISLTTGTVRKVHDRKIGFNTVLIGGNENAVNIFKEFEAMPKSPGNKFVGFVQVNGGDHLLSRVGVPLLGQWDQLREIVHENKVEEVIIAVESSEHDHLSRILNVLEGCGVKVKIIPNMYDILSGSVKMTSIFGTPLIEVNKEIMPQWMFSMKRVMDIVLSALALIILFPAMLLIGIAVMVNSKGPMLFKQERIGKFGKPFHIYKFRSMQTNAEAKGPQLSSATDPRITTLGRFLRRTRMDELPQFWNVLKGEMSLVGPRPERQFFITAITEVAPHYHHLQKVRPGITSWGQVKFGYAENVEQMVRRLKFDILYIENMSIAVDLKILAYTILIIFKGDGK